MRDAIQARIPGWREGLMPQRDLFGQPIPSPERLWVGSPFTVSAASTDKVRTEASRVGFASPVIPKSVDVVPGMKLGATDTVQLTPEQRDIFNSQSGQLAHAVLEKEVASPGWDGMPLIIKRQLFEKAFKLSRDYAQTQLLLHQDPAVTKTAVEQLTAELKSFGALKEEFAKLQAERKAERVAKAIATAKEQGKFNKDNEAHLVKLATSDVETFESILPTLAVVAPVVKRISSGPSGVKLEDVPSGEPEDINAKLAKLNAIADDHGITLSEARQFLEVAA